MNFPLCPVKLDEIDFEDYTFCLSFPCRALNLKDSLDLIGVIHPPVVRRREAFQIVCGRGRLAAARELGLREITCQVLPEWVDDLTCLTISFEENVTTRGFNLVEKALVVEKFQQYLPDEEIVSQILPRLGLGSSYRQFEFLQRLSFLEEAVKELVVRGELEPRVAVRLLDLEEGDRAAVLRLLRSLSPSASRQRLLLDLLEDLSRRERRGIAEILDEPAVRALTEGDLSPSQKTERLWRLLRARLMPHLHRLEEEAGRLAAFFRGLGLRLVPPPAFEKDEFTVEIRFRDLDEFWQKVEALWSRKGSPSA